MAATARRRVRGFTLVELLVALFALALLAMLSWRGLDGMMRARATTEARADEVLTLQIGLAQWAADLDALTALPGMKAIEWNGRVLRLTRRGSTSPGDGIMVVAWTTPREQRHRQLDALAGAPPRRTRAELEEAWLRADQWSRNSGADDLNREVAVTALDDWQLFFFRDNAWTNPQSSDVTSTSIVQAAAAAAAAGASQPIVAGAKQNLPDGVRIVLALPAGQAVSGTLTRDWVRPVLGANQP